MYINMIYESPVIDLMTLKCMPIALGQPLSELLIRKRFSRPPRGTVSLPTMHRISPIQCLSPTNLGRTNTLSLISSPWNTESLYSVMKSQVDKSFSFASLDSSAETINPNSTTTLGIPSISSFSNTTVPIVQKANNSKAPEYPLNRSSSSSCWSIDQKGPESNRIEDVKIKVNYPWSPSSSFSGTDFYPSSLTTLASRNESQSTLLSIPTHSIRFMYPIPLTPDHGILSVNHNRPPADHGSLPSGYHPSAVTIRPLVPTSGGVEHAEGDNPTVNNIRVQTVYRL